MLNLINLDKINDEDTLEVLRYVRISAEGLNTSLNAYIDAFKKFDMPDENMEQVQFDAIFRKVRNAISALLQRAGAVFRISFTALESIPYNAAYLESIFLNLITNSIKYSRPGVSPVISIVTDNANGEKTFTYTDNGRGFDMKKVGHLIFGLNQKFHGNEDSKGVGLYLVYSHVTNLGGCISVDSKVNQGTTFTIRFRE
jgi:light-regulated signal transduction histidine kinase (bacteriophytochrome)